MERKDNSERWPLDFRALYIKWDTHKKFFPENEMHESIDFSFDH